MGSCNSQLHCDMLRLPEMGDDITTAADVCYCCFHRCHCRCFLQNMGRDKAGAHTTFDAAAASALVEMHEYRSDALQVRQTIYLALSTQTAGIQ